MSLHIHNLKYLRDARKELRRAITPEEEIVWHKLWHNNLGYKFRRQHSIGNFIADFFCPVKRLVIELDGEIHEGQIEYDDGREAEIEKYDIKVIRFTNGEVINDIYSVVNKIKTIIKERI